MILFIVSLNSWQTILYSAYGYTHAQWKYLTINMRTMNTDFTTLINSREKGDGSEVGVCS
jgi:hypothetical protein